MGNNIWTLCASFTSEIIHRVGLKQSGLAAEEIISSNLVAVSNSIANKKWFAVRITVVISIYSPHSNTWYENDHNQWLFSNGETNTKIRYANILTNHNILWFSES